MALAGTGAAAPPAARSSPPASVPSLAELQAERRRVLGELEALEGELALVRRRLEYLRQDRKRLEQAVDLAVGAGWSGILRRRRDAVPAPTELARSLLTYQRLLSAAAARQFELEELAAQGGLPPERRRAVEALVKLYNRYVDSASALGALTAQLLQEVRQYQAFLASQLLWIPSSEPLRWRELPAGLAWLLSRETVKGVALDLADLWRKRPFEALGWALLVMGGWAARRRAAAGLARAAEQARRLRQDGLMVSLRALWWTAVLTLPGPALLLGLGWLLGAVAGGPAGLRFAAGLQAAGHFLLATALFRNLARPEGLGPVQLGWNRDACAWLRRALGWLAAVGTPLAFLTGLVSAAVPTAFVHLAVAPGQEPPGLSALGRVALAALLLLLAAWALWLRRETAAGPDGAMGGRLALWRRLWPLLVALAALGLAGAALAGYDYTAVYFLGKLGETVWFVTALVLARGLLVRALRVAQRRLRLEELRRQRRGGEEKAPAAEEGALQVEEETVDYGQLSAQVERLVAAIYGAGLLLGLWWIWREVVPALAFLDRIQLPITVTRLVDGVAREMPLTVGELAAGLLVGGLTLWLAKVTPAVLEFTVLQRLPVTRATRYALSALTQYLVGLAGLAISFHAVGLQWSSVQWLVAALSVGLGFGLQEIVANFVSGIILLFEQPIRVGDVVTIDGVTGTVARIRIRATTIVNWDRQELVVPNKTFITGRLINWTLSDTMTRLIVTVGVAYGSDTRRAMALMEEAARERPEVLDDPPPLATFEEFGDNALVLRLRAYLGSVDVRLEALTGLHQAILDKLEAAGIVIAFPQRDVHLEAVRPLEVVLRRAPASAPASGAPGPSP